MRGGPTSSREPCLLSVLAPMTSSATLLSQWGAKLSLLKAIRASYFRTSGIYCRSSSRYQYLHSLHNHMVDWNLIVCSMLILQGLCDLGAERIVVAGLPPVGCLPIVITLESKDRIHDRSCITPHNAISNDYNRKLQALLQDYSALRHVHIIYADIYKPLLDLVLAPAKYGKQYASFSHLKQKG